MRWETYFNYLVIRAWHTTRWAYKQHRLQVTRIYNRNIQRLPGTMGGIWSCHLEQQQFTPGIISMGSAPGWLKSNNTQVIYRGWTTTGL